ncbi:unnamed protein product [Musa acuminata var. zebrina]
MWAITWLFRSDSKSRRDFILHQFHWRRSVSHHGEILTVLF